MNWRAILRLAAFALLVAVIAPLQWMLLRLHQGPRARLLPWAFHRAACRIFGLRVEVSGTPAPGRTVFVANHLSHLDVMVLGSLLQASFVAKDEIDGWPVLGWLTRLQQSVFVSRDPRAAHEVTAALRAALEAGRSLVLFPEGTSSDGRKVLPFKSSAFVLFGEAGMENVGLQPVTVELLAVAGRGRDDGFDRDLYAYHGDASLGPHMLRFLGSRGARVGVRFHPPIEAPQVLDRKALAQRVRERVVSGLTYRAAGADSVAAQAAARPDPPTATAMH